MNAEILDKFTTLYGKPCCRKNVGERKSLSLGFGRKIYNAPKMRGPAFYGEWEIGTYSCAWRVIKDNIVICGSTDPVDSNVELDSMLNKIDFNCIIQISQYNSIDVHVDCC